MVTEVDHDAIKEQIVAILKTNSTLYDVTGASAKVRQINVEHPDKPDGIEKVLPSIYVTNSDTFERVIKIGVKTRGAENTTPLVHEFRYNVVTGVDAKDARTAINRLDDYKKLILETIDADHKLKNSGAAVVDDCVYESSHNFSSRFNGNPIQAQTITLLCKKVTI